MPVPPERRSTTKRTKIRLCQFLEYSRCLRVLADSAPRSWLDWIVVLPAENEFRRDSAIRKTIASTRVAAGVTVHAEALRCDRDEPNFACHFHFSFLAVGQPRRTIPARVRKGFAPASTHRNLRMVRAAVDTSRGVYAFRLSQDVSAVFTFAVSAIFCRLTGGADRSTKEH